MLGFYHYHHTLRIQCFLNTVFNLLGKTLLYLETVAVDIYHTGYLAQTGNLAVRDIGNMHLAIERKHVVLAHREEINIFHDDHLVVFLFEEGIGQYLVCILCIATSQYLHSLGYSHRCFYKSFTFRPDGFKVIATTDNCPCAAFENADKTVFGVQFHPEVERSTHGEKVLENFVINVCGAKRDYSLDDYIDTQIKAIREQVGDKRVLLGLSGGVDSSVVAALISKAIPDQLLCVYVDHGFMRKYETEQIKDAFKDMPLTLEVVDAGEHFLSKLKGVVEPEQKRKIIGAEFVKTFADVATAHKGYDFLAQGTIYPDVIESGANNSANIKSHHNVGGLPKDMPFIGLVEPLRGLFKDEVRLIGKKLGLPDTLVNRQPFPGPGLAIRTIGEITKDKLEILRDADAILREEILASGIKTDQYFAVITDTKSVGVIGDYRNYGYVIALRAVTTSDFMTAEYTRIPYDLLTKISSRIVNEVKGVSRVVYDVTGKPPATIEWE